MSGVKRYSDEGSCVSSHSSNSREEESSKENNIRKEPSKSKKGKKKSDKNASKYKPFGFTNYVFESHGQSIYSVQFNQLLKERKIFGTVGSNRLTIYECLDDKGIKAIYCFSDPDENEIFYSLSWSYNLSDRSPIVAISGLRGLIRIISIGEMKNVKNLRGHSQAVNELKFHPKLPHLLLSASKDHSVRLWNVLSDNLIAIFGGVEGHRDEALSADFDLLGENIISSGMDHTLMMWDITELQDKIKLSDTYNAKKEGRQFPTEIQHYPKFNTRTIHRNYVDCVKFFGDSILSKSCENVIVSWKPKPGTLQSQTQSTNEDTARHEIITYHTFRYYNGELWFVRFGMDHFQKILAVGSQDGSVYVWDLDVDDPALIQRCILNHAKCISPIRQATFSRNGDVLIVVCDDASIWRWDKIRST